ncbi:sensor histidine kinase [Cytophagaceae bacterium DM2B3-1]|uniref:histidine kinase n=1 Tax=Xanthocytophaga flava TaxID=3048013 RepID=A0ABT7CW41_9BACT|nr:sensor histidine kinase [Xanthocytophaga flavus]MDJ1497952.1 sensor histidine kinase [Xanthocytophaga flavus]
MKTNLFIVCFIWFCQFAPAQQPTVAVPQTLDSLQWFLRTQPMDTLYAIAMKDCSFQYIIKGEYDRADSLCQKLVSLQSQLKTYVPLEYCISFLKGTIAYHKGDYSLTLSYFLKAWESIRKNPSKFKVKVKIAALGNLALAYKKVGDLDMSMKYSLESIQLQEKYNQEIASEYQNIGNILAHSKQYNRAILYYRKALAIGKEQKNLTSIAITENLLGNLYDNTGKTDTAIYYYKSGLQYAEQAEYRLLQTDLLVNLGLVYTRKKQYKLAESYLKRGENLSRELESPGALRVNLHNQGEMYRELQKFDLAEKYYLEALELAKKTQDQDDLYTSNMALAELYVDTDNYKKAYPFFKAASVAKDSIFQAQLTGKTQQLLAKYEADKRQQEIALLNEKNRSQSLELAVQRRNVFLLIAGLLMSGIVGTVGYRRYQLRKRLEMEQIRNRIAADFHDELGANLSSIALYSDLLVKNAAKEKEQTLPILENISHQAHGSISSINDLIWTIKPDNDILERTIVRMKEFAIPLLEARNVRCVFLADDSLSQAQLSMNMRKFLYLIFKEAINNASKYAQATAITIQLQEIRGTIVLEIQDDGIGFDPKIIKRGNGLNNMKTRAKELSGQLTINTAPGQGTQIILSFKP